MAPRITSAPPASSTIAVARTTIAARIGRRQDRRQHGFRARQATSRRLLHHHPDHVPGPGPGARPAGDPPPRALADRPRHRRPLRHVPRRRCGRRFLDHDLRRARCGRRDGGRGGGRPGAGRDGGADHLDHGAAPARQGGGSAWAASSSRSAARSTSSTPRRTSTNMSARRPTPPTSASSSTTPSGPPPASRSAWSSGWSSGCRRWSG